MSLLPGYVPPALRAANHWILRKEKKPVSADGHTSNGWQEPSFWCSYDTALEALKQNSALTGIGFIIARDASRGLQQIIGVDLDACRDPLTGWISEWAQAILNRLNSYTEITPSGTGFHIWILGKLPKDSISSEGQDPGCIPVDTWNRISAFKATAKKCNSIEIYEDGPRHFTVSGFRLSQYPDDLQHRQAELDGIVQDITGTGTGAGRSNTQNWISDLQTEAIRAGLPKLDILKLINTAGWEVSGGQLRGPNPILGSSTGHNLVINPKTGLWANMHNGLNKGGDAWIWLACECGAVKWEDAGAKALKDLATITRVKEYAISKGLFRREDLFQADRTNNKNGKKGLPTEEIDAKIWEWIEQHHFKTAKDSDRIYHYEHGVYLSDGEIVLKELIEREFAKYTSESMVRDVVGKVKRRTYVDLDQFNCKHYLNVQNGLVDLDTLEILPHTPDYLSTTQIQASYDPDAEAPECRKFLRDVIQKKDLLLVEEIFGWLLWPEYNVHKALMLLGVGRNGKGTLLRLITTFLGKKNVSNVTLQCMVSDRYGLADLFGKMANIGGDLPATDLSDTAIFRNASGDDDVRAQEKYKHPFNFRNTAKLIFSANRLPKSPDDTYAFYSRWILIEFLKVYDLQKGTADPNLDKKLQAPSELDGLLNIALIGLERLKKNGWRFSYDKTVEDVEIMYKRNANPVLAFLLDECEACHDSYIEKMVFYEKFREYSAKHGIRAITPTKFGELIRDQAEIPVSDFRPWVGAVGERPRCWMGVKFRQSIPSRVDADSSSGTKSSGFVCSPDSQKVVSSTLDGMDGSVIRSNVQSIPSIVPTIPLLRSEQTRNGGEEGCDSKVGIGNNPGRYGLTQCSTAPIPLEAKETESCAKNNSNVSDTSPSHKNISKEDHAKAVKVYEAITYLLKKQPRKVDDKLCIAGFDLGEELGVAEAEARDWLKSHDWTKGEIPASKMEVWFPPEKLLIRIGLKESE